MIQTSLLMVAQATSSLKIPNTVKTFGMGALRYCNNLVELEADKSNPYFVSKDNVIYTKGGKTLVAASPAIRKLYRRLCYNNSTLCVYLCKFGRDKFAEKYYNK